MNLTKLLPAFLTTLFLAIHLQAEEPATPPASNEAIQKQLVEMQKSIQDMQVRHQAELDTLKKQLADQQWVIDTLKQGPSVLPAPSDNKPAPNEPVPVIPTTDPSVVPDSGSVLPPGKPPGGSPAPPDGLFPTTDPSVVSGGASVAPSSGLLPPSAAPAPGGTAKGS